MRYKKIWARVTTNNKDVDDIIIKIHKSMVLDQRDKIKNESIKKYTLEKDNTFVYIYYIAGYDNVNYQPRILSNLLT